MKTLSVQQLAQMKQAVNTLRMLRNPQAMIDIIVPKHSPLRALITGDDYDSITENILKESGFDPEQVKQQLLSEGII